MTSIFRLFHRGWRQRRHPLFHLTMKHLLSILSALLLVIPAFSQTRMSFNRKGEFKIVQFTDVHYIPDDPRSDIALERIREVLKVEKPELVVFTGDVACGKPADKAMETVMRLVSERKIPFAFTFGNHDKEFGFSNEELYDLIHTIPYNMLPPRDGGCIDFEIELTGRDGHLVNVLYMIDSQSYCWEKDQYEWILPEQIERFRKVSADYTDANGGTPVPSLAFFHIPLPEMGLAAEDQRTPLWGTRMERACPPVHNSGMFRAMADCGNILAIFNGHDHDNDYVVKYGGIYMCYGRYTGGNTVYNHLPNGARIILLKEDRPGFETWITLKGGQRINRMTLQ